MVLESRKFVVLASVKNSGHRRRMGVKVSVAGAASVTASASSQASVSLQEMVKLSWKALPESPLEPA